MSRFLAMPGSPLEVQLHGSDPLVASAVITVTGWTGVDTRCTVVAHRRRHPGSAGKRRAAGRL